jgi:hypothetical protein
MVVANTLAYHDAAAITAVKGFIVQAYEDKRFVWFNTNAVNNIQHH